MKSRKVRIALVVLLVLLAIFAAGQYDFHRVANRRKPLFARFETRFRDGGSTRYYFFGYSVTKLARMKPGSEGTHIIVGPVLEYWIPGLGREETKVVPKPDYRAILNPKPIQL